ncbi:MAG: pilus assembly protein PilP [Steroidobacteraceae bacterium]
MMRGPVNALLWVSLSLALSGCSDPLDELRGEIEKAKARPGGRIEPLPEAKPYVSVAYTMAEERSPFVPGGNLEGAGGLRPDSDRPREYLEQFPLDTLRMVGTLNLGEIQYGLVQTKDGLIHRVVAGNHLGQNDGRIETIGEAQIELVEIVPDGLGGYVERQAALALSD